ncbi:MAG: diguanylate cyclase [Magnetococcus sp. DMHC-8]
MYIDHKLGLGFGAMVGLMLLLASLAWQNMQTLIRMEGDQDGLLRMHGALLEARRHEKNYLLRREARWAEQAHGWMVRLHQMLAEQQARAPFPDRPNWQEAAKVAQRYLDILQSTIDHPPASHDAQIVAVETGLVPAAQHLHTMLEQRLASLTHNREKLMGRTEKTYAILLVFSMLVSALLVLLVTRSITASLKIAVQFAREIAAGNLNAKIPTIPKDEIGFLLHVMQKMGDELRQMEANDIRAQSARLALTALLETSLEPLSLQRQMEVALHIILTVPYLRLENKGAIFLFDPEDGLLHLTASHGLSPELLHTCAAIQPGHCLCGQAAAARQILYVTTVDDRHTTRYEGIQPHGHYCVPILSRDTLLGVMTFYLRPQHRQHPDEEAFLSSIAFTLSGILERKRMEDRLQHLAHHDTLTSLPNRMLFAEHLARSLVMAARNQQTLAVMLVDLDHFKQVNDTLGHAAGDQVLIFSTQRIRECLRASDLVARLGGDEFAVVLVDLPSPEGAERVAEKIVQSVSQPIVIEGTQVQVGASIGIALFPNHGQTADQLMAGADLAMYRVKQQGRNGYGVHGLAKEDG